VTNILTKTTLKSLVKPLVIFGIIIGGLYGSYLLLQVIMQTNTPIFVVTSESMHPVYYEGDILFVKHVPVDQINIGDDIVFYATWSPEPEVPIVHRVVDKYFQNGVWYFVTQGTNQLTNPFPDPAPTPYQNVIGVVVFVIPRVGLPIVWMRSAVGALGVQIMLIIIAGIIIAYVVIDTLGEKKEREEKEGLWTKDEIKETERVSKEREKDSEE